MKYKNFGQEESQILKTFRTFTKSHIDQFKAERDRVRNLLGKKQQYSSGVYREGILRSFLESLLPASVSVNSGFVYGFEEVENSSQIDILIWDSSKYGVIYKTKEFVIIPPEAVIAAISVKSKMDKNDVISAMENVDSLIELDRLFRRNRWDKEKNEPIFRPIMKFLVFYDAPKAPLKIGQIISEHYKKLICNNQEYANELIEELRKVNIFEPSRFSNELISTYIPKSICSIESEEGSYFAGWGPPDDLLGSDLHGPEKLKRIPYIYRQKNNITSQLDKFVLYIIQTVNNYLQIPVLSTSSAWADIHPIYGFRIGDVSEIVETEGWPLLNIDNTRYFKN